MKRFLALAAFLTIIGAAAFAGTVSTTMNVQATLAASFTISATNLDFGSWNPFEANVPASATITVTATANYPYHISLDKGTHYGFANNGIGGLNSPLRSLAFGTSYVGYYIFQDAAFTTEWGDSDFANTYPAGTSEAGTGTGTAQSYTAYGALLTSSASSGAAVGTYTDFITVTVNF